MAERVWVWHQFAVQLDYGPKGYSLGHVTCRAELEGDIDALEPTCSCIVAVGRKVERGIIRDDYTFLTPVAEPLFREIYVRAIKALHSEPERSEMLHTWRRAVQEAQERSKLYDRYEREHCAVST